MIQLSLFPWLVPSFTPAIAEQDGMVEQLPAEPGNNPTLYDCDLFSFGGMQ